MADFMPKKDYDLTEITRLLLEMRDNCVPKAGDAHDDPKRAEKYEALNAAIFLINNPSMLAKWISVKDRLPESDQRVLFIPTCNQGSVYIGQYAFVGSNGGVMFAHRDGRSRVNYYAKYWMPLPEPPKEA